MVTFVKNVGRGPFTTDHDVLSGLVPEIVVELYRRWSIVLVPTTDDIEVLIHQKKATRGFTFGIAQTGDHDFT